MGKWLYRQPLYIIVTWRTKCGKLVSPHHTATYPKCPERFCRIQFLRQLKMSLWDASEGLNGGDIRGKWWISIIPHLTLLCVFCLAGKLLLKNTLHLLVFFYHLCLSAYTKPHFSLHPPHQSNILCQITQWVKPSCLRDLFMKLGITQHSPIWTTMTYSESLSYCLANTTHFMKIGPALPEICWFNCKRPHPFWPKLSN